MPQMMPLSWLILFIMFSAALLLFTATNFYILIPKSEVSKNKIKVIPTTWKWQATYSQYSTHQQES